MKIKFSRKNIIYYIYAAIILANIVAVVCLYSFVKKYIYGAIAPNKESIIQQSKTSTEDINMDKFESIIEQIEKKTAGNKIDDINDIFD